MAKTYAVLFGAQAITVQLYPGRDRFEFYQGKASERLGI